MDPFTAISIGGAVLGGLAGAQGGGGKEATSRLNVGPESELERQARLQQEQGFGQLDRIQREDFARAGQASQAYGDLLKQYQQTGGLPTSADLTQGRSFAEQMLAPQQAQIDLAMRQSTEQAREQAALSGRGPTDFAMQTKLAGQRSDLMSQLGAQQSAMGAQYAQQLSQNRLGYAGQFAELQQGLATQAMQNRMAIMGLGSQIQQAGQQFRLGSAPKTVSEPGRPGGLMGALTGAFTGAQAAGGISNLFGGGGTASASSSGGGGMQGLTMPQLGSSAVGSPTSYGLGPLGGQNVGGGYRAPSSVSASSFSLPSPGPSMYQAPYFNAMQPNNLTPMGLGAGSSYGW